MNQWFFQNAAVVFKRVVISFVIDFFILYFLIYNFTYNFWLLSGLLAAGQWIVGINVGKKVKNQTWGNASLVGILNGVILLLLTIPKDNQMNAIVNLVIIGADVLIVLIGTVIGKQFARK